MTPEKTKEDVRRTSTYFEKTLCLRRKDFNTADVMTHFSLIFYPEVGLQKRVFLEIPQNSQENNRLGVSFLTNSLQKTSGRLLFVYLVNKFNFNLLPSTHLSRLSFLKVILSFFHK